MKLYRYEHGANGIFGSLTYDAGLPFCSTLEHAYAQPDGSFLSKISDGVYNCVRGTHQLEGMKAPFQTFKIMQVPDVSNPGQFHTDILFHVGNTNADSAGCVLLGSGRTASMILQSQLTFNNFMKLMDDIDSFQLTVTSGGN